MKKLSRMESNKEARRILVRNMVDLCYCQYSCCGRDVRLTGSLYKTDGSPLSASQVEAIINDFGRFLPGFCVVGDLDNWSFSSDHITSLGEQAREEERDAETYVIELEDDYDLKIG
jgi:hypothetical protein